MHDNNLSIGDPYFDLVPRLEVGLGTSTNVVFKLEGVDAGIQGLIVQDTNIRVKGGRTSESVRIIPYSTGTVEVASALSLANISPPQNKQYHTNVWSTSTVGGGGTGLYFVNTVASDELVSRKRAIIYGLIF